MPIKNYKEGIGMTEEEIARHQRFTHKLKSSLEYIVIGAILTGSAVYAIRELTSKAQEISLPIQDLYTQIQQYFNNIIS